jgi:bacterioferritin-associated ferredoxin
MDDSGPQDPASLEQARRRLGPLSRTHPLTLEGLEHVPAMGPASRGLGDDRGGAPEPALSGPSLRESLPITPCSTFLILNIAETRVQALIGIGWGLRVVWARDIDSHYQECTMFLCLCKVVRVRSVQQAVRQGEIRTVAEAMAKTGAGTGCGACRASLQQIVEGEIASCEKEGPGSCPAK